MKLVNPYIKGGLIEYHEVDDAMLEKIQWILEGVKKYEYSISGRPTIEDATEDILALIYCKRKEDHGTN